MLPEERNIDPRLAHDLAKPLDDKQAADLSKQAIAGRDRDRRLQRAALWARTMNRTFKGITGSLNRRGYVLAAIQRDPVLRKEWEEGRL